MPSFTENLEFNPQIVYNLIDGHTGYANYLNSLDDKKYSPYIASSLLIGAVFSALVSPQSSIRYFQKSARFYQQENNYFWKIAAICGNDVEFISEANEFSNESPISSNQQFANILSRQFNQALKGKIDSSFPDSPLIFQPVGRLGIPMNGFIRALIELADLSPNFQRLETLNILLKRAAERLRLLQSDTFHWKNLKGTFLPIEPEILATCIICCQYVKNKQLDFHLLRESLRLDKIEMIPLMIAEEIVYQDGSSYISGTSK